MTSEQYWINSSKSLENEINSEVTKFINSISIKYKKSLSEIFKYIINSLTKYTNEENIVSNVYIHKKLSKKDTDDYIKELNKLLKTYLNNSNKYIKNDVTNLNNINKLNVLDSILIFSSVMLGILIKEVNTLIDNFLNKVYKTSYFKTIYNIQKGIGYYKQFNNPNNNTVNKVIYSNWSGDSFSSRLWKDKNKLIKLLSNTINNSLIKEFNINKISKTISKQLNVLISNVNILVRTETNHVLNKATLHGYSEQGLQQYEFLSTLDSRTSNICSKKDKKIYTIADAVVGVNLPPMHPNCRSTITPHIDINNSNFTRFAKTNSNLKTKINGNISYSRWLELYNIVN